MTCPSHEASSPSVPGSWIAELRQPGTNVVVQTSASGTLIPRESHCVTDPDLVVLIGPRHDFGAMT